MAFTSVKKGTKRIPRDPRNRHNSHPNPGGGGDPPAYPSPPLQAPGARGGNTDRGVLSAAATSLVAGRGDVGPGGGRQRQRRLPHTVALNSQGFALHYDDVDVFILQLERRGTRDGVYMHPGTNERRCHGCRRGITQRRKWRRRRRWSLW
jgi:hypothetical protein